MTDLSHLVPRLVAGLAVLLAFWLASRGAGLVVRRVQRSAEPGRRSVIGLLGQAGRVTLLVLGVVTALGTAGVNVAALVAGLGLTGFALGFAFRDALSNLIAGVLIVLYRPFRQSDQIMVGGFQGVVTEIDLRYTVLEAEDKRLLIPNSMLFTNAITVIATK